MPVEKYPVQLTSVVAGNLRGVFMLDEDEDEDLCHLSFQYPDGEIAAGESDYFEAMCKIRLELEKAGWCLVCYGSSRKVYPSGMCRDMGSSGLKAYKLQLGPHH